MCGIAGIVNFDGAPVDRETVERMTSTLAHRGPDGSGVWVRGNLGFGHRRLAIRDLSDAGRQPMVDDDARVAVTYNGEIYNDLDLRRDLSREAGTVFRTTCDTEVIAPAYRQWGKDAFLRFEGMFALALWDEVNERVILARDPIGIKPLYFSWVGRSIRFGSEIKAILALHDQPRTLSREGLHSFFAQGYPGPKQSLVDGIVPLPPGCVLVADRDGFTIEQYWRPQRSHKYTRMEEALEAFQALWPKVVGDMLISDVPVGLLLSGGIDSALVATALKGHAKVRAYTAVFNDATFDESSLSTISARYAGLDHKFEPIDAEELLQARFLDIVAKVDGQLADSSSLAFYSLCQKARSDVPVLLTGDGADEFFAGYETYRATRLAAGLGPVMPRRVAQRISRGVSALGGLNRGRVSSADKLARFFAGIANGDGRPHTQWRRYLFPQDAPFLYGDDMADLLDQVDPLAGYGDVYDKEMAPIDAALLADQQYYLPGDMLMKSDSMSMAHGVEIRVPFLDRRMMEFSNSLHPSLVSPLRGPDKRLLRAALASLGLPSGLTKASKRGFNIPVDAYLRGPLKLLGDRLLDREASRLEPILRPDAIRNLWRRHIEGDSRFSYVLWTGLTLAAWRDIARI